MNGRNISVMEAETSFKKGSRKRASVGGTETAINSKLANKTKQLRAVNESKKYTEQVLSDNEKGHQTRSILRSNKSEQNFPQPQIKDEIQAVKKGVKHKKEKNSGEDQTRTKSRKIQSPSNAHIETKPIATEIKAILTDGQSIPIQRKPILTERKPISKEKKPIPTEMKPIPVERKPILKEKKPIPTEMKPIPVKRKPILKERKPILTERKPSPTEQPVTAEAVSNLKGKQKANLLSPTDPPVENRKLGHKSKKGQVKPGETSQKAFLHGSVSAASLTFSKKLKVASTITGTVDSKKKKTVLKKTESEGVSSSQIAGNKTVTLTEIDTRDPMAVLMMMEGRGGNLTASQLPPDEEQEFDQEGFTSSDEESGGVSDWEEVYDHQVSDRSQLPNGPVEITLELPDILKRKKRQKQDFDWKTHLERRVKRFKKQVAADMHKVHLLCLLALGLRQNDVLNDHTVKGVLLSLLPGAYLTNKKLQVQMQVENLLLWHKRKFPQENVTYCSNTRLITSSVLIDAVSQNEVTDARVWILLFVCLLRTVGLSVRLVLSFQPMRFKAHQGWDEKKGRKKQHQASTDKIASDEPVSAKKKSEKSRTTPSTSAKTKPERSMSSAKSNKPPTTSGKAPNRRLSQRESSKKAALKNKNVLTGDSDADDENYISEDETADDVNSDSDFSERGLKKMKEIKKKSAPGHDDGDNSSSESDFTESSLSSPVNILKELKISSNRKILSPSTSDDEAAGGKRHGPVGHDIWLEVYFPDSKKWICFNCFKSQFGKPHTLGNSATQPLMYILGLKNDNSVKDVTARYSRQWLSHTRKNRIDQEWWTETLLMFDSTSYNDKLLEDDEIKGQLLVQPMPSSIAEFKSHPLYALRRHLLKFEAIYPESAVPLGYVRKEPVYARECVHVLHSRDNWLKEGRLVRLNELPYKMVKSRPKWNKPKEDPDALDLQLFGAWQTEKYMPPPAVNGKVPRNEYGNVELFKPWMMPLGTVQVRGQGLQRVAKKLNIDVAPAMIGWDSHSGRSHPVMDGWIVCEEFADTLMAAWLEDQEIQKQREQERKDKQVYDNWRRLIRGLLIRERLKTKFLQEAAPVEKVDKHQETFSDAEEACDVQQSWPRNRQDEVTEHKVKTVQAKIEREKQLLMKDLCNDSKILNKKVQNKNKINVGSGTKKVQGKKMEVVSTKCKPKVPQVHDSGSSSSSDDDNIVNPKLLNRKVNSIRNSLEEEDPDFIVSEKKVNTSQNNRSVKNKTVSGDEGKGGDRILGNSNRRTSLARQVKRKVKLVDVSSDESDFHDSHDEKFCPSVGDETVQDDGSSSPGSEPAQVTSSKTKRATTKPTRKRLKPKT